MTPPSYTPHSGESVMSRGSPILSVRVPADQLEVIDRVISEINARGLDPQYDRTSFVLAAIREKIAHRERSRLKRRRRKPS